MEDIDARKLLRSALNEMRSMAICMREELQLSWREIARVVGVSTGTVLAWLQRYASQGNAGLESRKRGRTYLSVRTLTLQQEWLVRTILTSGRPQMRGLEFALSSHRVVMQRIEKLFGIDMPIRTVGECLFRWATRPSAQSNARWSKTP